MITPLFICVSTMAQIKAISPPEKLTGEAYAIYLSDPEKALTLTQEALNAALESKNVFQEGFCYFLFSKAYWVKANYKLSAEYGFKALEILKDTDKYTELSECLLTLGRTFAELGSYQKAHEFIRQALILGNRQSDEKIKASAFREHSYLLAELNQLDSALHYSDRALSVFEKTGDSVNISILYGRKARIYHQQSQFRKSADFAYRALLIDSLVGNSRALGIAYYQVAQNEYALGNREKAVGQLKQSIRINNSIGNLNWKIKAHELLSDFYLDASMAGLAAEELKLASRLKDEFYNSQKNGQIREMQALHDLEAKEKTIQLLERENALRREEVKNQRLFLALLLIVLLFLMLLTFVLTRLRTIQKKTNRKLANRNIAIEEQRSAIQLQAENLRQLDQIKTKLFSVISHDLRGPISNLQSLLDMFTQKLMTADEFVSLSDKLRENLNVTQRTLENLLTWSLSQMGGIRTEKKKVEVTSFIEEVCQLLDEVAGRKNIILQKEFSGPVYVWADGNQLQVILRNLIHNAIKFSSFNARIDILAVPDNGVCEITIKDSGIGMTEGEINTLIGSKEYFSKSGTEQEKGTGLGLMLCKEFILRNGGEITIRSAPGEGTEVSFTLLLAEHQTNPQVAVPQ